MLRHLIPFCVFLTLFGCGDDSKKQPSAPREVPEAVKTAPAENTDSTAKETPSTETRERQGAAKSADADEDVSAGEQATAGKKNTANDPIEMQDDDADADKAIEEAVVAVRQAIAKGDFQAEIAALEKLLELNADDINLMIHLAQRCAAAAEADPAKPDYPMYGKAADYVRKALQAVPALSENAKFESLAGTIFFNEARALAVDKKNDEALQALKTAIESGFKDFDQIEKQADLEALRAAPDFAENLAQAKAATLERFNKKIDGIFAETKPFDFDFELTDIEDNAIAKADFKGKVLIVDVWGTWCPPCKAEIPHFVELVKNYKDKGLEIVGLNAEQQEDDDESLKIIQKFHKSHDMNYRCALMKQEVVEGMLKQIPGFRGFPTTLFFDRGGKLRAMLVGPYDYDALEAVATRLLDEKTEGAGD